MQPSRNTGNGANGSVAGVTDNNDNGRTETMTYDWLDRVLTTRTAASSGLPS